MMRLSQSSSIPSTSAAVVTSLILGVVSLAGVVAAEGIWPRLGSKDLSTRAYPAGQQTPGKNLSQPILRCSQPDDHQRFLIPTTASPQCAVVNMAPHDGLNIRARPGVSSPLISKIPYYGVGIHIRGTGEHVASSFWVPIQYEETRGWVNSNYLARQVGSIDKAVSGRAAEIIWALKNRESSNPQRTATFRIGGILLLSSSLLGNWVHTTDQSSCSRLCWTRFMLIAGTPFSAQLRTGAQRIWKPYRSACCR